MAMEGTHVRFARDLAETLGVVDRRAYYSGAVYPDSRYLTGIPRTATHNGDSPDDPFAPGLTDFEKGWATHVQYDRESVIFKRTAFTWVTKEDPDQWVHYTSMKLVEDMRSVRELGEDVTILREIAFVERPRGEDPTIMETYYADLREAYQTQCGDPNDYRAFSLKNGIDEPRVNRMILLAESYLNSDAIVASIHSVYDHVLRAAYDRDGR
ncbi:hypothetical protein EBS80_04485 [bacterium]|nr:hypothetical protein [bacterium]